MPSEFALLENCLIVGVILFGLGAIGFLSRRNLIVMFLSVEIMLQGVSLNFAAWGRYHNNFSGQAMVLFIIAVAACEAAVALALVMVLFARRDKLDAAEWHMLREANQPAFAEPPLPPEPDDRAEPLPRLAPAGVRPEISREETDYRPKV